MNFWSKYSYNDYENAYCHRRYAECKEIGVYLLAKLKDDKSKKLLNRLNKFEHDWMHPDYDASLLTDVKIWLMINANNF